MKNVFDPNVANELVERIKNLKPETPKKWGIMNAAAMLAHCNVTYETIYENKHTKPTGFKKLILKTFVKPSVINVKPYRKNSLSAPHFIISEVREFDAERKRLIDFIEKTQQLGTIHFHEKESHSLGPLSEDEWNNLLYKHLDHHLNQFGV